MIRRYYVITPEYGVTIPVTDDGQGPYEYGADVIEIEADCVRDAIALGVREMLQGRHRARWCHGRYAGWCERARDDGVSPYAGVKAILAGEDNE